MALGKHLGAVYDMNVKEYLEDDHESALAMPDNAWMVGRGTMVRCPRCAADPPH